MCKAMEDMRVDLLTDVAWKLLERNVAPEVIAASTGLSLYDIEKLANEKSSSVVPN